MVVVVVVVSDENLQLEWINRVGVGCVRGLT